MSEKRFTIHKESKYKEEWYAYPFCIKEDGEVVFNTIPLSIAEKVRDKLNEQQAIISRLEEEKEYWKSKAMTLLSQVCRLTPKMSAKEVIEFGKELEDE